MDSKSTELQVGGMKFRVNNLIHGSQNIHMMAKHSPALVTSSGKLCGHKGRVFGVLRFCISKYFHIYRAKVILGACRTYDECIL